MFVDYRLQANLTGLNLSVISPVYSRRIDLFLSCQHVIEHIGLALRRPD